MNKIYPGFFLVFAILGFLLLSCGTDSNRKIKLRETGNVVDTGAQEASSILQVTAQEQHTLAVNYFKNNTGEPSLNWLRRGVADMLISELSQSPYLNIISTKELINIASQSGLKKNDLENLVSAIFTARKAGAEVFLGGQVFNEPGQLCVELELYDVSSGQLIRREKVFGRNLENIFTMVDELSQRVRSNIQGDLENLEQSNVTLSNMTTSLEAFRHYSEALENMEKFLQPEAIKSLKKALYFDSTFAVAYLKLAEIKLNSGQENEGARLLRKAKNYPEKLSEVDKISLRLLQARVSRDYDQLIPILKEGVRLLPNNAELRRQLAVYYRNFGFLDQALEEFEIALALSPGQKTLYNELGYVFAKRGDFSTALKYFEKYQKLAPEEPNPYDSKGEILMEAGRFNEAIVQLQTALEKWPNFPYSRSRLADIYTELGNYDKAIGYLDEALNVNLPEIWQTNLELQKAVILWRFGKKQQAKELLLAQVEAHPMSLQTVALAGEFFTSQGKPEITKQLYQKTFEEFEKIAFNDKHPYNFADNLIGLFLSTDIPTEKSLPVLEEIASRYQDKTMEATLLQFALSLVELRAGNYQNVSERIADCTTNLFELLVMNRKSGWGSQWKFVQESVNYESDGVSVAKIFSDSLLEQGKRLKRKDLEVMAHYTRALYLSSTGGNKEKMEAEFISQGTPPETTWWVVGPYPVDGVSGFTYAFPPEGKENILKEYQYKGKLYQWQPADDGLSDGYVNLKAIFDKSVWSVAYGTVYIYSPDLRKVQIRLGTDEACRVWLNDDLIWQHYLKQDAQLDRDLVTVVLHPGYNKVLLKVTNTNFEWGYYFRVTDENGDGIPGITFHSPVEVQQELTLR
ncbi:MAG: hypothetical protein D6748_10055 [Calditrichaeota bacterium]|nr:MAG: hypothetical protein D6748_10055 [Calditrichota bacterium]